MSRIKPSFALAKRRRAAARFRYGWEQGCLLRPPEALAARPPVKVHPSVYRMRLSLTPSRHVLTQVPASPILLQAPLDIARGVGQALIAVAGGVAEGGAPPGQTLHGAASQPFRAATTGRSRPAPPRVPTPAARRVASPVVSEAEPPPDHLVDPFAGLGIEVISAADAKLKK